MLSAVAPMIQPLHRQLLYRRKPSLSNKVIRFFFRRPGQLSLVSVAVDNVAAVSVVFVAFVSDVYKLVDIKLRRFLQLWASKK